jgi:oligopeptide/dipeptide ABC transporter ATP-binding protein
MYLGKIVEMSRTEELFEHPVHPYTRALLSAAPVPDPEIRRPKFVLKGEIPSPINLPSGCHLHTRCPAASAACRTTIPELEQVSDHHWVSCIRARELGFESSMQEEPARPRAAAAGALESSLS